MSDPKLNLKELLELDPEKAKIRLQYEQLKQENHWTKSPLINFLVSFVAGALISLMSISIQNNWQQGIKDEEINNLKEQAEKDMIKDIYAIFVQNRDTIYSQDIDKCRSFAYVTAAIYGSKVELATILDNLVSNVKTKECKSAFKITSNGITEAKTIDEPVSPKDKTKAADKADKALNAGNDKIKSQIEGLIQQFTQPDRKIASLALSDLANKDKTKKSQVVDALIRSIVKKESDGAYRINLYIAYTLAHIENWNSDKYQSVCRLKESKYYSEQTFATRVNNAIKTLDNSRNCSE
jgi:hypothetical protein